MAAVVRGRDRVPLPGAGSDPRHVGAVAVTIEAAAARGGAEASVEVARVDHLARRERLHALRRRVVPVAEVEVVEVLVQEVHPRVEDRDARPGTGDTPIPESGHLQVEGRPGRWFRLVHFAFVVQGHDDLDRDHPLDPGQLGDRADLRGRGRDRHHGRRQVAAKDPPPAVPQPLEVGRIIRLREHGEDRELAGPIAAHQARDAAIQQRWIGDDPVKAVAQLATGRRRRGGHRRAGDEQGKGHQHRDSRPCDAEPRPDHRGTHASLSSGGGVKRTGRAAPRAVPLPRRTSGRSTRRRRRTV